MRRFYVIENNAGGIEMFVTEENSSVFEGWFTDYEFNGKRLLNDIAQIINGDEYVNMWDNNFIYGFETETEANCEINRILDDTVNNTVIAEYDGITITVFPHRMSSLTQAFFALAVE